MTGGRALREAPEVVLFRTIQEAAWARGVAMLDTDVIAFRDALLPVVEAECRRRAAEELRAAAAAIDDDARVSEARQLGQAQRAVGEARSVVLERADAIEGRP